MNARYFLLALLIVLAGTFPVLAVGIDDGFESP